MGAITYRKVDVDGINIFYREAGPKEAATILLLHGLPTAGHMFRDLIPQLADRFRLVAPDFKRRLAASALRNCSDKRTISFSSSTWACCSLTESLE
jgi:pimeloyl-ACP methyl ester carboxylesterase